MDCNRGAPAFQPSSPRALEVGDIVVRRAPGKAPVLHRIVEIQEVDGERVFVTQGDANRAPDPEPVALEGPGDRVVYSVPYVGYILNFGRSAQGRVVFIAVPLALLAILQLRDRRRPARDDREPVVALAVDTQPQQATASGIVVPFRTQAEGADLPAFLVGQLQRRGDSPTTQPHEEERRVA